MRFRVDAIAVIAVLLCAVIVVGEVLTYSQVHHYDASAEWNENTVDFTVSSSGSDRYDAVLIDNHGRVPVDEVFIYEDETYDDYFREASGVSTPEYTDQEVASNDYTKYLNARSFDNVSSGGEEGLLSYLTDSASPSGKGLIVTSYALPSSVYDCTEDCILVEWLNAGGTLYWMHSEVGRFYVDEHGLQWTDGPSILLGDAYQNTSDEPAAESRIENGFTEALCLKDSHMRNALCVDDVPGSIRMGYSVDQYASIAGIPFGEGQIFVLSGKYDFDLTDDLAQLIASGITVSSEVVSHLTGTVTRGTVQSEMDVVESKTSILYVYVGGTYTKYGETFHGRCV